ncbi:putative SOS response-associated peptidase YedK [Pseudomonas duriflava]|uniref:Abasic site processing protein n=1 Tax=Pseudomonas duriflava TaxID=459528 RepID=A0A562QRF5_9PSED|nr:SOS response-associated peptidase family protein [Pseudomonas duriflava]TWI58666.1 putative SOS response-associated peptidase YedK [Pseudomonas duriflava]
MCGRFAQYRAAIDYIEALKSSVPFTGGLDAMPMGRYNVAPSTRVRLLHETAEGIRFDPVPWGYTPFWARKPGSPSAKRPPVINARVETAATSKMFRSLWKHGRALVAADGWYEWKKDPDNPKRKQPYFICLASREPLFFAAIGQFHRSDQTEREDDGFVIVTSAADTGMVDIHDRSPLVLSPDAACEWMEPDLPDDRIQEIAHEGALRVTAFKWYPVNKAVGNVRNDYPELLEREEQPAL